MDWLLAVGCSLTWGSEITEKNKSLPQDKDQAWPAHLADLLRIPNVINKGYPGRSNGSIFRVATEEIIKCYQKFGSNGIVVIQWSGPARLEIVNPFVVDVPNWYKKHFNLTHPDQEGPYFNVTPTVFTLSKEFSEKFPFLEQYFFYYWAHDFYQLELWINYSISVTSLAQRLGVKILQFNGIDCLDFSNLPENAAHLTSLIGSEYLEPCNSKTTFWKTYRDLDNASSVNYLPQHPTFEEHKDWAKKLYQHLKTVYPTI